MRPAVVTFTLDVMWVLSWSPGPEFSFRVCELAETMWNGQGCGEQVGSGEEGPQLSVHLFSGAYDPGGEDTLWRRKSVCPLVWLFSGKSK